MELKIGEYYCLSDGYIAEITGYESKGYGRWYINNTHAYIDRFDYKIYNGAKKLTVLTLIEKTESRRDRNT